MVFFHTISISEFVYPVLLFLMRRSFYAESTVIIELFLYKQIVTGSENI